MWHAPLRLAKSRHFLFTGKGRNPSAMILTCPSCQTKYVVKDGAIPPNGRQVRCANCKESWHQMPEGEVSDAAVSPPPVMPEVAPETPGPAEPSPEWREEAEYEDIADDVMASEQAGIAAEPVPDMRDTPQEESAADDVPINQEQVTGPPEPAIGPDTAPESAGETFHAPAGDAAHAADDDFAVQIPEEDVAPRGKGRLFLILALLLAIAAAAAWFFAPPALKARLGIASSDKSPLELMVTTSDRQQLASGNELLAISGRVINPTAEEQSVPPIRAELRNKVSKQLVYQWTIAPPARSLPPGGSATFNSAEVDIPPGGDELTVTLTSAAG